MFFVLKCFTRKTDRVYQYKKFDKRDNWYYHAYHAYYTYHTLVITSLTSLWLIFIILRDFKENKLKTDSVLTEQ